MLYTTLIYSVVLLALAILISKRSRRPVTFIVVLAMLGLIYPTITMLELNLLVSPIVLLQALFMAAIAIAWRGRDRRPANFVMLSSLATLAACGMATKWAMERQDKHAQLLRKYPFESIEERLPLPPPGGIPSGLVGTAATAYENEYEYRPEYGSYGRQMILKHLHENSVDVFTNTPGFGRGRFVPYLSESGLKYGLRTELPPLQPSSPGTPSNTQHTPQDLPPSPPPSMDAKSLRNLHFAGSNDFAHAYGHGYVKDRQHVAGFQSHQFSKVPTDPDNGSKSELNWEVARLELVSLLLKKEPAVYLSDRLPAMDQLKGVPTRPLDEFETAGLAALRKGETLYVRDDRMIGAVRSTKQCLDCHGGSTGDLLGAFTYILRPTSRK